MSYQLSQITVLGVLFSAVTGLLMGFDLSIIAVILPPLRKEIHFCPNGSSEEFCFKQEFFVAIIGLGALVGGLLGGVVADCHGRRTALCLSDVLFILGALSTVVAQTYLILCTARSLIGAGVGVGFVVFDTYVSEIAPDKHRGQLVMTQEIAQCVGVLLTFLAAACLGDTHWRAFFGFVAVVAAVQLIAIPFLPESPRWLRLQGRLTEAKESSRKLHQFGTDEFQWLSPSGLQSGLYSSSDSAMEPLRPVSSNCSDATDEAQSPNYGRTWRKLLRELRSHRRVLAAAVFIGAAQNFLFTNAVLYYSTDLLTRAGVTHQYAWGVGFGVMKLMGTGVVFKTVDVLGRRVLLLCGTTLLGVACAGLGYSFSLIERTGVSFSGSSFRLLNVESKSTLAAAVVCNLFLFLFAWEISWASLMHVVAAEVIQHSFLSYVSKCWCAFLQMLPSAIRGAGMGLVNGAFWATLFISQICFQEFFRLISVSWTFVIITACAVIIGIVTYVVVPDLTGQSLEYIERSTSRVQN